ncbi:MAG: hypothetical protein ABIQ12_13190 [Opitutaceae bacterium]
MTIRDTLRRPSLWVLVAVCALEFFLFDWFGAHRHTAIYPRWNDQIQYLSESYTGYEYARAHGFFAGLWQALTNRSAQGTLHDVYAIIVFTLAGPSRSAALAINMLALIAWQAALFAAVLRVRRSAPLALACALLPLALAGPWRDVPGSAYDFRLDHMAMCSLGVTAALALLTEGFRSRGASLVFGVATGITLLARFLTGTYFIVILLGLLAWTLSSEERQRRTRHVLLAALTAAVVAGPILWLNFETARDYYWIGHYIGPESAIRNSHMGLGRSLAFVGSQLLERHLGLFFTLFALGGAACLALLRFGERQQLNRAPAIIGAFFVLAPALVLTLHQQKSEVVVGALAPGVVTLTTALWLLAARRATDKSLGGFAAVITVLGLGVFTRMQVPPAHTPAQRQEFGQVNTIADRIFTRGQAAHLPETRVAVDYITDCLDAQVVRVICYERHRVWLPFNMTLPTGIAEPAEAEVFARLALSDFVFLTELAPAGGFPFDQKLAALRPQLRAWCEANLRPAERFTLFGRSMVLYQRREIPLP